MIKDGYKGYKDKGINIISYLIPIYGIKILDLFTKYWVLGCTSGWLHTPYTSFSCSSCQCSKCMPGTPRSNNESGTIQTPSENHHLHFSKKSCTVKKSQTFSPSWAGFGNVQYTPDMILLAFDSRTWSPSYELNSPSSWWLSNICCRQCSCRIGSSTVSSRAQFI